MKQLSLHCLFTVLLFSIAGFSQTNIPPGNVSGTWTAAGSPYLVQGHITLPVASSLIIEPGVQVLFQGLYSFNVHGNLTANGTATDSIYFTAADTANRWNGFLFYNTSTSLSYCNISYTTDGFGALYFNNSTATLSHCAVTDNRASGSAGLDIEFGSRVNVSHSSILRNSATGYGGGIGLWDNSFLSITDSDISFNQVHVGSGSDGGGIWSGSSDSLLINNCVFNNNIAGRIGGPTYFDNGGAIGVDYGNGFVSITNCIFNDNTAVNYGGALYLENCQPVLYGNNFSGNTCLNHGAAVYLKNCQADISYCIFQKSSDLLSGTLDGAVALGDSSSATIDHCNFYDNTYGSILSSSLLITSTGVADVTNCIFSEQSNGWFIDFAPGSIAQIEHNNFYNALGNFYGSVPSGLGTISGVNANGTPCDTFYNIYQDPLYVNPANGDFHLQAGSPCIDAGDPNSPPDPDGTTADIGVFYYLQLFPVVAVSDTLLDFRIVVLEQQNDLPLTIRNAGTAPLRLQSIINQQPVFTHNWTPVDSLVMPGDSLTITVSFAPTDTIAYHDTLHIETSDHSLDIMLSGRGQPVVGIDGGVQLPTKYALYAAYPNPFNSSATITFDLPHASHVTLLVYDALGRKVTTLVEGRKSVGRYTVQWDGTNNAGQPVASGVYLYRLIAGDPSTSLGQGFLQSRKMLLIR